MRVKLFVRRSDELCVRLRSVVNMINVSLSLGMFRLRSILRWGLLMWLLLDLVCCV